MKVSLENQKINTSNDTLLVLTKAMERPPGTSFIGSRPSSTKVRLNPVKGPQYDAIIDSGSDITLMSAQALAAMPDPPKRHQGKQITLSQVTAKTSIDGYVDLPLFFDTDKGPVQLNVEAYVVKGMTTPFIIGNDISDQYSLSIVRNPEGSSLHFGTSGRSLKLHNTTSDSHVPTEVKAFMVKVKAKKHKIANEIRKKEKKAQAKANLTFFSTKNQTIPPFTSQFLPIKIPWQDDQEEVLLEVKDLTNRRLVTLQLVDTILSKKQKHHIMAINPTDTPVLVKEDALGYVYDVDLLDDSPEISTQDNITKFTFLMKAMLQSTKGIDPDKEEREHAESQPEQPAGPKTAEIPDFALIPKEDLIKALDINPRLDSQQKKKVQDVLIRNHLAFSLDGRIGKYEEIQYEIRLTPDATPVSLPPYHASPEKRQAIDAQLDKWYSQDVIEPSDSPWGAPVIVVYRFGKPRVCIDYRRVNAVSEADQYPLPRQTDILQALTGSQWLSTFDALSGFQQVEIKEEQRSISAFRCHRGLLQFKRLPFGLRNGPSVFQRIMNKVLAPMLWLFVLVYIDDIVVYSKTFEDHLHQLDRVLKAITKANITLSPPKCHIGYQSLILLGQKVSRLGISTHKEKVDAIQALVPPTKVSELQSFLGMVNYFSNYIPFYSWITRPLYALLRKDKTWEWGEAQHRAFELCKEALGSAPVLGYPIPGLGYRLYTDATGYGIR